VSIDPDTHTAEDKKKYDYELLEAGTRFLLRFELLLPPGDTELETILAHALAGIENAELRLGARKSRGFGRTRASQWSVWKFDLKEGGLVGWLSFERPELTRPAAHAVGPAASALAPFPYSDQRRRCLLEGWFGLEDSLLIRSNSPSVDESEKPLCRPDSVHLRSRRNGALRYVLSGTSLAGALRHRAERIANTRKKTGDIVKTLFGWSPSGARGKGGAASHLLVEERIVERHDGTGADPTALVHTRVSIDRFTGGAWHDHLFSEQPVFAGGRTGVALRLLLKQPSEAQMGLLLLLMKDLWNADLPVGGEASVGRGRLLGQTLSVTLSGPGPTGRISLERNGDGGELRFIESGITRQMLENYAQTFREVK